MLPLVGASMPRIMRASVVLPLPDWPTMVNISGAPACESKADIVHRRDAPAREQAAEAERLGDMRELEQRGAHAVPPPPTAKQATR